MLMVIPKVGMRREGFEPTTWDYPPAGRIIIPTEQDPHSCAFDQALPGALRCLATSAHFVWCFFVLMILHVYILFTFLVISISDVIGSAFSGGREGFG